MQYFGYVLMLVALEPLMAVPVVYFAISPTAASAIYLLVTVAVIVLASLYAYVHSKDIRKWILD